MRIARKINKPDDGLKIATYDHKKTQMIKSDTVRHILHRSTFARFHAEDVFKWHRDTDAVLCWSRKLINSGVMTLGHFYHADVAYFPISHLNILYLCVKCDLF